MSAVGCLSTANVPDIPGLDEFGGDWYHTGQWPHEGVEFAGKRVGLIGTGWTGIQAAPVIAGEAEHLYVFQRTPNYSVPARNAPMSPARDAEIESHYSDVWDHARRSFGGFPYDPSSRSALEVSPRSGRRCTRTCRASVGSGSCSGRSTTFSSTRRRTRRHRSSSARRSARIDTDYYATLNRENVTLVDVRSDPIKRITPAGLETGAAGYEVDTLVFATGFDAMTGALLGIDIRGRGGATLRDRWAHEPHTYLGLQVAG